MKVKPELVDHRLVATQVEVKQKGNLPGLEGEYCTRYRCEACNQSWDESEVVLLRSGAYSPSSGAKCPGARVYSWEPWPEGLATRKQLAARRLNPGPLAGVIPYDKSADGDGWLRLYRESEATPKPALSEKRQAALAKMRAVADAARHCQRCGRHLWGRDELAIRMCDSCSYTLMAQRDQREAAQIAYDLVCQGDFVVWDSETTDLYGKFIELAVVDAYGKILFEERIRPGCFCEPGAYEVHGIPDEALATCPSFFEVYDALAAALHHRNWVIYNSDFDCTCLRQETHCSEYKHYYASRPVKAADITCAMHLYAAWNGDWHDYYHNYRWQKLTSAAAAFNVEVSEAAHSALGDSLRTLGVIYGMADWYRREIL